MDREKESPTPLHVRGDSVLGGTAVSSPWLKLYRHCAFLVFMVPIQVFTSTSTVVFKTFACDEEAVEGKSFLRADYSLSCNTAEHTWYKVYAGVMIVVRKQPAHRRMPSQQLRRRALAHTVAGVLRRLLLLVFAVVWVMPAVSARFSLFTLEDSRRAPLPSTMPKEAEPPPALCRPRRSYHAGRNPEYLRVPTPLSRL